MTFRQCEIRFTNEHENGAKGPRCVQIVVKRGLELVARGSQRSGNLLIVARVELGRIQPEYKFLDPLQSRLRFFESIQRKVQLLAIANRNEKVTNRQWIVAFVEKTAQGKKISFGLRHFLAVHEEMFAMNPKVHERAARDRLALRDLVFMMGKQKINTTAMEIECLTQILHRHCGTFEMPARPALAKRRRPPRFARILWRLP